MTMVQTPFRIGKHALKLEAPLTAPKRRVAAPARKSAALADTLFGIEVLRPQGWVPLTVRLGRRVRTFGSMAEAMDACILHWRRTGHGARPFRMLDR
ncbi:MAG: hypothetical protein ACO1NM_09870 [Sphingobium phenoxybenzoativorans]